MRRDAVHLQRQWLSGGFTLVEVLVSLGMLAVLLLATQSAIVVATRSLPDGNNLGSRIMSTGRAMDLLSADLTYAVAVNASRKSANDLEFTVADRNGDGQPETIRYTWSGTPGGPLLRQYNGGAAVTVLPNVQEFQLVYDTRTRQKPTTYTEGSEAVLASNNPQYASVADQRINSSSAIGQYVLPALPANASSWRITRVQIEAKIYGFPWGESSIQIRTPLAGLPSPHVLEQVSMYEWSLYNSYTWQTFSFANVAGLSPRKGVCITVLRVSDTDSCQVLYQNKGGTLANGIAVLTSDGGSTWTSVPGADMIFYLHGKITTPDPPAYQTLLTGVRCTLRSGSDPRGRLSTSVRVLAEPEVPG